MVVYRWENSLSITSPSQPALSPLTILEPTPDVIDLGLLLMHILCYFSFLFLSLVSYLMICEGANFMCLLYDVCIEL